VSISSTPTSDETPVSRYQCDTSWSGARRERDASERACWSTHHRTEFNDEVSSLRALTLTHRSFPVRARLALCVPDCARPARDSCGGAREPAAFEPDPAVPSGYENSLHHALLERLTFNFDYVHEMFGRSRPASCLQLAGQPYLAATLRAPPRSFSQTPETRGRGEACVPRPFPWAPSRGSSSRP
jgi:hypothetical protein